MDELRPFLRQLLRPAGGRRRRLLGGAALLLATVAAGVGLLGLSGWFITATAVAGMTGAVLDVYRPSAGIRTFAVGRTVARYFERLIHHDAVLRLLAELRGWLFRRMASLSLERLGWLRGADLLHRLTADVDALDNLYLRVLGPTAVAVAAVLLAGGFLALFSPAVAWAVVGIFLVAGLLLPAVAMRRGRPHGEREAKHLPRLRIAAVEAIQGLAELRAYGAVERYRQRFAAEDRAVNDARRAAGRLTAAFDAVVGLAGHLALVAALWIGVDLFWQDAVSGPVLALMALAVLAVSEAVAPLPAAWQHLGRTRAAAGRLLALGEPGDPCRGVSPGAAGGVQASPTSSPAPLALQRVTYRHRPYTDPVLEEASLTVAPGESVVVTGASGAGKSTAAELILGLRRPGGGSVRYGGIEVVEIAESERFAALGYLTQRTDLFAGTVAANLCLGDPGAGDDALRAALRVAGLDAFVARLPEGLGTWIGEGGTRLSGGEARRLALARLVLAGPRLVVLDEPFTGLDGETARLVRDRLGQWLDGRTAITFTHAPHLAPRANRRLSLDGGRFTNLPTPSPPGARW